MGSVLRFHQSTLRADSFAGETLNVKETDDIDMIDKSNQLSGEPESAKAVEEKSAVKTKPFQLTEGDSAGSAGRAVNIGWKPGEHSKREEVSVL